MRGIWKSLRARLLPSRMLRDDPAAILERLLGREPGHANAYYLKASRDFWDDDWTYEQVESIESEFAKDFRSVIARIESEWGKPDFFGHPDDAQLSSFNAEELCFWRKGEVLAMVWWEHQEKEVPVLLGLAVVTPGELRE